MDRSWIALATIVSSMLATVAASGSETPGQGPSAAAPGINCGCPEACSDAAQINGDDGGRIASSDRLSALAALQPCFGPHAGRCTSVTPTARTGHRVHKSRPLRAGKAVRVLFRSRLGFNRLVSDSTLWRDDRAREDFATLPWDEPLDDGTSQDPDDDDDLLDDLNADDTDVPIIACREEMTTWLFEPVCALVTWTAPRSSTFLTLRRMRC